MKLIDKIKSHLKKDDRLKRFSLLMITSKRNPKPRLWVKIFVTPFLIKRGKNVVIRSCRSRFDIFPWHKFEIGSFSTIEDFTTISNGAGAIILGERVRIGIGSVVVGPVTMGSGSGLGQNVFVSGFNHGYQDGNVNSSVQPLDRKPVIIGEESHVGANCVVLPGIKIGRRCQIGAGSVVTKDVPDFSVVVGNPARVIKQFDHQKQEWVRV